MSDTSNVLKAPAGGRYDRGWCEPNLHEPKQCIDDSIRVPQKQPKRPTRDDRFVRGVNPPKSPAWQARQIAQLSAVAKKQAWYEEVVSNLMSAERWKALPEAPVMVGAAVVAAVGAGCQMDTSGLPVDCDAHPDYCVDAGPQADTGIPDSAVDGAIDGTTPIDGSPDADAAVVVDDRPTITWPSLNTLPNNRAFVRWNPPSETEPGKTVVGYQVSWSDGSNNYSKEVTFPFTAIDILSSNTMHSITVRARYNDASYGQSSTQAQVIADTSLMARYTMDEGAGTMIMDDSGNGNHGTLVNFDPLTAWTQGIIGTGLLFDGVDSYVDTGNTFNFDSTDAFTIEAWVRRNAVGGWPVIFSRFDTVNVGVYTGSVFGFSDTNELRFAFNSDQSSGDKIEILSVNQFNTPNVSQNAVMTYDGSMLAAGARLYVDGIGQSITVVNDNLTGSTLNSIPSRLGAAIAVGGPIQDTCCELSGAIDDLAIYNRALSPDEILNNNCAREALHSEEVSDSSGMPANCN